jgi:hypothetical protein
VERHPTQSCAPVRSSAWPCFVGVGYALSVHRSSAQCAVKGAANRLKNTWDCTRQRPERRAATQPSLKVDLLLRCLFLCVQLCTHAAKSEASSGEIAKRRGRHLSNKDSTPLFVHRVRLAKYTDGCAQQQPPSSYCPTCRATAATTTGPALHRRPRPVGAFPPPHPAPRPRPEAAVAPPSWSGGAPVAAPTCGNHSKATA